MSIATFSGDTKELRWRIIEGGVVFESVSLVVSHAPDRIDQRFDRHERADGKLAIDDGWFKDQEVLSGTHGEGVVSDGGESSGIPRRAADEFQCLLCVRSKQYSEINEEMSEKIGKYQPSIGSPNTPCDAGVSNIENQEWSLRILQHSDEYSSDSKRRRSQKGL